MSVTIREPGGGAQSPVGVERIFTSLSGTKPALTSYSGAARTLGDASSGYVFVRGEPKRGEAGTVVEESGNEFTLPYVGHSEEEIA